MSDVFDAAVVRMIIADYANADTVSGKANILGGGVTGIGLNAQSGLTAPFALFVSVSVPPSLANEEAAVEILLEDSAGEPVALPSSCTRYAYATSESRAGGQVRGA